MIEVARLKIRATSQPRIADQLSMAKTQICFLG
jgi:hypothetical protein